MVRCPGCGLVFQDPQPSDDVLARSYYHDPEFAAALLADYRDVTVSRARANLARLERVGGLAERRRVLDVGCSSGAFLELADRRGLVATGVEVGVATVQQARKRGLDVRLGTLEQALPSLAGERFDLITFWDVLEHTRDPRRELELARTLLGPSGLVAATFPNIAGLYPTVTRHLLAQPMGHWEYPELPLHLFDFSPGSARRLFEAAGYTVSALNTHAVPFSFYRSTSLSSGRLGRGGRGLALRVAFEALRLVVYPLAAALDRRNALFVLAGS